MKIFLFLLLCLCSMSVFAAVPGAYVKIAKQHQVNSHVLYAIARAESTRPRYPHPWPWTANINGKGYYFKSRDGLYRALKKQLLLGRHNFDVGTMQINWKYNAHLFGGDLWAATDPYTNIAAGALHLNHLLSKHKSYTRAIGLYHAGSTNTSARKARADRYTRRVFAYLNNSGGKRS